MVAAVNVIITKGLFADTPGGRDCKRIMRNPEDLPVAVGKRLIGGAVVPSTPEGKELISSMFYFNRCVKGRRFAELRFLNIPVFSSTGGGVSHIICPLDSR